MGFLKKLFRGERKAASNLITNKETETGKVSHTDLNSPTEKPHGFLLHKVSEDEILELEKAGEIKRSSFDAMDMEGYVLDPPEGERFQSKDNLTMKGILVCPICAREMPVQINEINFSGFLGADSVYHAQCSNCHAITEFRGITTGEDSEGTRKYWLVVFPESGPSGVRAGTGSRMSQPRIRMESIERSK
jgi:hypothetical protein